MRPGREVGLLALTAALVATGTSGAAAADDDRARRVFRLQDTAITESSGLVDLGARMVTTNDSGDGGRLYVLDDTGRTVAVREYAGEPVDVEALAPAGDDAVWVGDIGDNDAERASVTVTRVPLDGGPVASYELTHPGGRAADAESLLVDPEGRLVLVTKSFAGGAVLRAPARLDPDGPNRLEEVARTAELAATDAALLSPTRVLVRGYGDAGLYAWPSWELVDRVPLPDQPQGEGISVGPGGRVRVSSEGAGTPVWQLPAAATVTRPTDPASPTGATTPSAAPDAGSEPVPTDDADREGAGVDRLALGTGLLVGGVGLAVLTWVVQRSRRRRPDGS